MIAVDTNLLVYAHRRDSPFHQSAFALIKELAEGSVPWAIAWPTLYEFFSVCTRPRMYDPPSSPLQAVEQIDEWLKSPSVVLLSEGPSTFARLRVLVLAGNIAGAAIHDARIAVLCLENGVEELLTADRDFSAFPELSFRNPL